MPPRPGAIGDLSNDDYVAQVLANEARDNSKKYALEGLGAYMPKKPSGAAPKPNTRFLRHIIRETDNHNTALKRKEEREARERMRQLREQQAASSSASHDTRRHRGDRDRERESGGRDGERERRDGREREHRRRRHRSRSMSEDRDRDRARRHRRGHESEYERSKYRRRDRGDDERDYSRRHRSYSRSRSRSPRIERDRDSRGGRRRHGRSSYHSRSPERSRSRSPERSKRKYKEDGDRRDEHRSSREHRSTHRSSQHTRRLSPPTTDQNQASDHDSDPLEDLVGPLPQRDGVEAPMRSRGRGAYKPSHSNIDAHFAKDYDPTLDVHLDDDDPSSGNRSTRRRVPGLMTEDDDWELALEALRDRTRWKQKGEERLRQAGFSESTVDRWKNNAAFTGGNTEGSIEDVKWSKKGEGREWDRGKVFDEDGHVDVRAPW